MHDWDRAKQEACPTSVVTSILNFDMNFVLYLMQFLPYLLNFLPYLLNFLPCFLIEASSVCLSASETSSVRRWWKESTLAQSAGRELSCCLHPCKSVFWGRGLFKVRQRHRRVWLECW